MLSFSITQRHNLAYGTVTQLLETQGAVEMPLISEDEIARIRTMWADDAVTEAKRHLKQREQLLAKGSAGRIAT